VVVFNQILTFKGALNLLSSSLKSFLLSASKELLSFKEDPESLTAILLAETRALYKNEHLLQSLQSDLKDF
jgi:hypothetical protein